MNILSHSYGLISGLAISRVEFSEGGFCFDKFENLWMALERLVFDVCAVPLTRPIFSVAAFLFEW